MTCLSLLSLPVCCVRVGKGKGEHLTFDVRSFLAPYRKFGMIQEYFKSITFMNSTLVCKKYIEEHPKLHGKPSFIEIMKYDITAFQDR